MLWGTLGTLLRFRMENEMQILYVSENVVLQTSLGKYQLIVKGKYDQQGVDRALKKCNLTLEEVEVVENG